MEKVSTQAKKSAGNVNEWEGRQNTHTADFFPQMWRGVLDQGCLTALCRLKAEMLALSPGYLPLGLSGEVMKKTITANSTASRTGEEAI